MKRICLLCIIPLLLAAIPAISAPSGKRFEDVTIRFFVGGDPGDPFASVCL